MAVASVRVSGNVTEALAALDRLGIRAEEVGKKTEHVLGSAAKNTGNAFSRLGNTLGSWGIPFTGSLTRIGDKLGETETKGKKFGTALAEVGKTALMAGAAGIAVVGTEAIKMAGNFQSAAEHLVTDAGESQAALAGVEKGMLAVSSATGTSANSIVDGMYHIESAGFHGAEAVNLLRTAAEGAKAGGADLNTVAQTLTGTMHAYNIPVSQSVQVMNQLITTVGSGDMRLQDLATSLGNVAPVAAAAHIKLSQVGGAIATMTAQNMSAQQATQDLKNLIMSLEKPTAVQAQEMDRLGISAVNVSTHLGQRGLTGTIDYLVEAVAKKMGPSGTLLLTTFKDSAAESAKANQMFKAMPKSLQDIAKGYADGTVTSKQWRADLKGLSVDQRQLATEYASTINRSRGFNDLLKQGGPAAQTFNAALADVFGNTTSMNAALMLSGPHMAEFADNAKRIQAAADHAGTSVDGWAEIQKTFNQKLDVAKTTVTNLGITLGMWLIPKVESLASALMDGVKWLEKHKDVAEALGLVVGGALALAVGTYAVNAFVRFGKSVADAWRSISNGFSKLGDLVQKLMGVGTASEEAAIKEAAVGAAASASAAEAEAAAETTGTAWSAALGPIGLVAGAAMGLFAIFHHNSDAAQANKANVEALTQAILQDNDALTANTNSLGANAQKQLADQILKSGVIDQASKLGITYQQVTDAITGNSQAYDQILATIQRYNDAAASSAGINLATGRAGDIVNQAYLRQVRSGQQLSDTLTGLKASLAGGIADARTETLVQQKLGTAMSQTATSTDAAANATKGMSDALNGMQGALGVAQALDSFKLAEQGLAQSVKDQGTASLDENTAAGLANHQALLQAVQAIGAHVQAMEQQHATAQQIAAVLQQDSQQLENAATAAGMNKQQVDNLVGSLLKIPPNVKSQIAIEVQDQQAQAAIAALQTQFVQLDQIASKVAQAALAQAARGGPNNNLNLGGAQSLYKAAQINRSSYDIGGWVHAALGAPQPAIVHGGEYVLSAAMLAGQQPIDTTVLSAISKSLENGAASNGAATAALAAAAPGKTGGNAPSVTVQAITDANPYQIASEVGWLLRQYGWAN